MLHTVLLGVHITAGTTGLLGPLALGLVALSPGRLWWLGLVAGATEAPRWPGGRCAAGIRRAGCAGTSG